MLSLGTGCAEPGASPAQVSQHAIAQGPHRAFPPGPGPVHAPFPIGTNAKLCTSCMHNFVLQNSKSLASLAGDGNRLVLSLTVFAALPKIEIYWAKLSLSRVITSFFVGSMSQVYQVVFVRALSSLEITPYPVWKSGLPPPMMDRSEARETKAKRSGRGSKWKLANDISRRQASGIECSAQTYLRSTNRSSWVAADDTRWSGPGGPKPEKSLVSTW